jgi:hypothetical protein
VSRRDHLVELLFGDVALVFADVLGRDDGVDAVRLSVDMVVDPLELYPEPAGSAHRSHDVAAVAERKNGKLDPQPLTDLCLHANTRKKESLGKGDHPLSPGLKRRR